MLETESFKDGFEIANVRLPSCGDSASPMLSFVRTVLLDADVNAEDRSRAESTLSAVMELLAGKRPAANDGYLDIRLARTRERVFVDVYNRGEPVLDQDVEEAGPASKNLATIRGVGWVELRNLGRSGQLLRISAELPDRRTLPAPSVRASLVPTEDITIRPLNVGVEEGRLSRLFFAGYGYHYISEYVYNPDLLTEMHRSGKLESFVAVSPDNRLVGHVGMVHLGDGSIHELGLGVVDPRAKAAGVFSRLLEYVMEVNRARNHLITAYDFVTNHAHTQRLVHRLATPSHAPHETALMVANQSGATQARLERFGMHAEDNEADRYSILYAMEPNSPLPFGNLVTLPTSLGEIADLVLEPLGIHWKPTPRFSRLSRGGHYTTATKPLQRAVEFRVDDLGRSAVDGIVNEWNALRRDGYLHASIDIPLDLTGLGQALGLLARQQFFWAGFMPFADSPRLAFRVQAIAPAHFDFGAIETHSPVARSLVELVQREYERNHAS